MKALVRFSVFLFLFFIIIALLHSAFHIIFFCNKLKLYQLYLLRCYLIQYFNNYLFLFLYILKTVVKNIPHKMKVKVLMTF